MAIPEADAVVDCDWVRSCWEPDARSEAMLHDARFHAAPALRRD